MHKDWCSHNNHDDDNKRRDTAKNRRASVYWSAHPQDEHIKTQKKSSHGVDCSQTGVLYGPAKNDNR